MVRFLVFTFFLCTILSCQAQKKSQLVLGAEQLTEVTTLLKGKRVGLVVNNTAMVGKIHLADTLKSLGVNLVRIFGPEHGFRGDAADGELVKDSIDHKTGVPVISLYGKNKKQHPLN